MSATIRDVATEAGVAVDTARKALRRDQSVRPYLQERVDEAVARLQYRPNRLAQALSNQISHVVPIVLAGLDSPFFSELALQLGRSLAAAGYVPAVSISTHELMNLNSELRTPGCIICCGCDEEQVRTIAADHAVATLDKAPFGVPNSANVRLDFAPAYRLATRRLLAEGRRRVAICTPLCRLPHHELALGVYGRKFGSVHEMLTEHGLALVENAAGGHAFGRPEDVVAYLAEHPGSIDAVFCENDLVTASLLSSLALAGVRIPDEVRVIGCDGLQPLPTVWTVSTDLVAVADALVAQLSDLLAGKPTRERVLRPTLVDAHNQPIELP